MKPATLATPRLLALLAPLLLLAGCVTTPPRPDGARTGPFHTPANVRAADYFPEEIRRVALLPCASGGPRLAETTLADLDRVLATNLVASARAEVVPVSRQRLRTLAGRPAVDSTAVLPADLVARVLAETGADALVFVDVTAHSAYPPLVLGLRARLVRPGDDQTVWNFDNLFSAARPEVANSARAHALGRETATRSPADLSHAALQNPLMFADYAADAMWSTLPPR